MQEGLKTFWKEGDFDFLLEWLSNVDPVELISTPAIAGIVGIVIAMNFYKPTAGFGLMVATYAAPVLFILASVVVLKNDSITDVGPFIMATASVFMVVGWFIWAKMLRD